MAEQFYASVSLSMRGALLNLTGEARVRKLELEHVAQLICRYAIKFPWKSSIESSADLLAASLTNIGVDGKLRFEEKLGFLRKKRSSLTFLIIRLVP